MGRSSKQISRKDAKAQSPKTPGFLPMDEPPGWWNEAKEIGNPSSFFAALRLGAR
jgi:hypothetical protein